MMLSACHAQPEYAYLGLTYHEAYQPEQLFLKSLLQERESQLEALGIRLLPDESSAESMPTPDIYIQCLASWEYEAHFGDLVISKTYMVPQEDALAGRRDTTLEACIRGEETLVALNDLKPPYIALRVDGMSLENEQYPLVKVVGISIQTETASDDPKIDEKKRDSLLAKVQGLEALLQAESKPLIEESPEILWIASAGDLMLGRGASEILLKEGPEGIFGGTAEFLLQADLALVNLEGAVSKRGTKVQKSFNFRFDPQVAPALGASGIDGVLLANNHVFDYGEEAFRDSLTHLKKAEIQVLGAGLDEEAAAQPFIFTKGNTVVRVFGIASFPKEKNGWDPLSVAAAEGKPGLLHVGKGGGEKLKSRFSTDDSTLDIVLFHGGEEWSKRPNPATRELYQDLIQHGADLVIGSHPHIVQGFEWVLGKAVFWSLGNFVFAGMDNTGGGDEGLFIRLGYSGTKLVYLESYPLTLNHTRTTIAPMEKLVRFYQLSKELELNL